MKNNWSITRKINMTLLGIITICTAIFFVTEALK